MKCTLCCVARAPRGRCGEGGSPAVQCSVALSHYIRFLQHILVLLLLSLLDFFAALAAAVWCNVTGTTISGCASAAGAEQLDPVLEACCGE